MKNHHTYMIKKEVVKEFKKKYKQEYIAREVGISKAYVSLIFSQKKTCSKKTAYCITKLLNSDAEITDFFEVV